MRSVLPLAACLSLGVCPALAQPDFDVASVTAVPSVRAIGEGGGRERIQWTPTSVILQNTSLSGCIQWAYEVKFYQVAGPAWVTDDRWDIVGKTEHAVNPERLRAMLQSLLTRRFRLALHRTERGMPVFELVVARGGPKLAPGAGSERGDFRVAGGRFVFKAASMGDLAARLSELAGVERPVVDKTGISGIFDFSLPAIPHLPGDGEAAWLFSALEEQLGLALKPARGTVPMLVVDHAEKPSPN